MGYSWDTLAGTANGGEQYVGYSFIAAKLSEINSERERPYSRQAVCKWYYDRKSNGFPEARNMATKSGRTVRRFSFADVLDWYFTRHWEGKLLPQAQEYIIRKAQERSIRTIPLFDMDSQGNPCCAELAHYATGA